MFSADIAIRIKGKPGAKTRKVKLIKDRGTAEIGDSKILLVDDSGKALNWHDPLRVGLALDVVEMANQIKGMVAHTHLGEPGPDSGQYIKRECPACRLDMVLYAYKQSYPITISHARGLY